MKITDFKQKRKKRKREKSNQKAAQMTLKTGIDLTEYLNDKAK